jgi:hypothetical protein
LRANPKRFTPCAAWRDTSSTAYQGVARKAHCPVIATRTF